MAIKVMSEESLDQFGITISNFVVSINGKYEVYKNRRDDDDQPVVFNVIVYLSIYTSQGYSDRKKPIIDQQQKTFEMSRQEIRGNVFAQIYQKLAQAYTSVQDLDD